MLSYAIGDIHGQLDKLLAAHALIAADRARPEAGEGAAAAPVIHLGDLGDRGPQSRGVIEHLMAGQAEGRPWVVLCGNHDRMFLGFMADPAARDPGLRNDIDFLHPRIGGGATLASYGVDAPSDRPLARVHAEARARVPAAHLAWLAKLPLYHLRDEALFVHAGVRPGIDLRDQRADDLLWIRHEFLEDSRDHGALVVHGHSAIEAARHYGNRLNLDSGAGYGGPVSAVAIAGRQAWLLTPAGRVELPPRPEAPFVRSALR